MFGRRLGRIPNLFRAEQTMQVLNCFRFLKLIEGKYVGRFENQNPIRMQ